MLKTVLNDVHGDANAASIVCTVELGPDGQLWISTENFGGGGVCPSESVVIENLAGTPRVVVWASNESDEPTHIIELPVNTGVSDA